MNTFDNVHLKRPRPPSPPFQISKCATVGELA